MSTNNYEKCRDEWAEKIAAMDPQDFLAKIPDLIWEEPYLKFYFYGHQLGVSMNDGRIVLLDGSDPLGFSAELCIYCYLWYHIQGAVHAGEYVPFASLKDAGVFEAAFKKSVLDVFSMTFAGHAEELREACEKLNGEKLRTGDVGYEIPAFPDITMQVLFWDADEEFPASVNLLFDKNTTQFIHVESVVSIAGEGLAELVKAAGVELKGSPF